MIRCAHCNTELSATASFCSGCGTPVDIGKDALRTEPYTPPPRAGATQKSRRDAAAKSPGSGTVEIGTMIHGRYRILSRLGSGNMGSVYRAQDLSLGEDVALKFISPQCEVDAGCAQLLTNEVKISRQVTHPNVCRVHDLGEFDGRSFISMEYVDGEDLSSLLHRIGHVHGAKAHQIARQLCAGLQAAHDRGVLHRDLKPANVMLDGDGDVRIADFGIAAAVGAQGSEGIRGTPAYMAPELFTGAPATEQTDLYSLGLVLFELYTGERLFDAQTMTELLDLHRTARPAVTDKVKDVDPKVEAVIESLLQRDPDKRPTSALAVLARLPGGDPLAAALASGETPSPMTVAEAGGASTVSKRTALIIVACILSGWVLICWLGHDVKLLGRAPLPRSGSVLAQRAIEVIDRLFADRDIAGRGSSWRFESNDAYLDATRDHDDRLDRWDRRFAMDRPAFVDFWYRSNPRRTPATNIKGRIRWNDPPFVEPGMIRLRLTPRGHLQELQSIPKSVGTFVSPKVDQDAPWEALFAQAGLDIGTFTIEAEGTPRLVPHAPITAAAAWSGVYPGSGMKIRVEAAACSGEPVHFVIVEDRGLGPQSIQLARNERYPERQVSWRFAALILIIFGAIALAWNSLARGRADRRGAAYLGLTTLALVIAFTLLTGDHNGHWLGFGQLALKGMIHGLSVGGVLTVYYLAFEPHVRRAWPETMISWSRVLAGRFQDSLVGFHVLVGLVLGIAVSLFNIERHFIARLAGEPEGLPLRFSDTGLEALRGTIAAGGAFMEMTVDMGREAIKCVMVLALLKLVTGSRRIAGLCLIAIFTWVWNRSHTTDTLWWILGLFGTAIIVSTFAFALIRYGVVSMMVAMIVYAFMLDFPLSLNPGEWYASRTMLSFAVVGGLTLYAFRTATRFSTWSGK